MADILQLNPPLPVVTPYGDGYAHFMIDYGQEHHILWVVAQDSTGEFWTWENPKIRMQNNVTMNRPKKTETKQTWETKTVPLSELYSWGKK